MVNRADADQNSLATHRQITDINGYWTVHAWFLDWEYIFESQRGLGD